MEIESARPMAHEAIYTTVEGILAPLPKGRLLDVPAGEGALASELIRQGWDVQCCDLYPEIFRLPGVEIKYGDLSKDLPYETDSFDCVVCVEGLEHIENPHQAIREFARIVRPGGDVILSIPNTLNIEERLKWLFFGYTSHFKPLSREYLHKISADLERGEEIALHINPLAYPEIRFALEKNGFRVQGIYIDKRKKNTWAFRPLTSLIRLVNRFQSSERQAERWSKELQSDEMLLGGNTLIMHARSA